ncbi:hypothetical protein GCM10020358_45180 [Amorphoplanes nipponensis]|uniref:Uncharacterized protein n=1 Tax=Actinoplanes nipponensis TaxID=135950 RepID=A0A919JII7_9ACTN|nr:hypothetical protein [Actinoplanes nipponensis]GIE49846.1 hypothetical protein Ani05nite_33800 [Actinoplanes nipponensis]
MDVDAAQTAAAVMPYVTAAVTTYGMSTLDRIRDTAVDKATDATVGVGQRMLNRLLGREESREILEGAVLDVVAGEQDSESALRLQIRKALAADPELAQDVAAMLPAGSVHNEASGAGAIAIGTNSGIANTGANASFHR